MSFIDFFRKKKKKLTDGAKTTLGNLAGEVKNTLKRANQAPEWMKRADMGLSKFSQKAENFPKFEFADKVKNPVGRFVATIPQEIMNIPSRTVRGSLKDYGKVKATPQYLTKRGSEAANIGVDIGSTFAGGGTAKNLIKEGFKQTTKTGLKDVIKTGAKRGFKEGTTYGGASGFFAGAQEGESLRDQGVNALKSGAMGSAVGGGAGFVLGGTMAGGGRVAKNTKDGVKREIMNISDDVYRFKNPYKKRIVNETKEVPNGAIVDGQPVTMSIPTGKRYIQTIKDPFKAKSITGKVLTARPGLNIQDINSAKPKIISSKPIKQSRKVMDFNDRIALKNKKAAELVNNQKTNQKLNLDKTEDGFILPKDVKAPEMKFRNSMSKKNYIAKQKFLEKQPKKIQGTAEQKSLYKNNEEALRASIGSWEYAIKEATKRTELKIKKGIKVKKSEIDSINAMKEKVRKFKTELTAPEEVKPAIIPKSPIQEELTQVYHDPKKRRLETKGGYLEYSIDKDSNEFIIDYVEATEKRKGIGTKLMNAAEKIAEKEGLDVGLAASPQDDVQKFEDLKDFYESLGYENVAEFGDVAEFSKKNADLLFGEVPTKFQKTNPFIQPKKQVIQEEIKIENPFLPKKPKNNTNIIQEANQTIPKPPIKEASPVIKPEPEVKPKIEENAIQKLKEYQKYKKETIDKFINSEDGYKMMVEAEVKGDMFDPINENVYKGIKSSPFFKKERQIDESMGEGFLLEKNGRYLVADAQKAEEYAQNGWKKKIEIDSLANEAGFERGSDYLDFILNKGEENKAITSPKTIARRELMNDPAYAELEREIKRLTPLAKEQKALMPKTEKNPFITRAKSTKELIQESPFIGNEFNQTKNPFIPEGGFNQFQQRAYNAKNERIKKLGEVLNRGNELLRMGYRKNEINRKGIDEIKRIEKLSKLGYPKAEIDKMDFDRMDLIINREVPWTSLKDYYERKHALDTNFLRDIDPQNLKDIAPLMTGGRDAYRNFEKVFGKDYPKIKERLLDPFDEAKGRYIDEQKELLGELNKNIVQKFGITKGSEIDKAVVAFGEGKIGIDELKQKFPKDWKNIVEADKWFRTQYSKLLGDLNTIREAFFPTHPLYPESTKIIPERKDYYRHGQNMEGFGGLKNMFENSANIDPSVAVMSDVANPKTKWLSFGQRRKGDANELGAVEGYLDYLRNYAYARHIDPYIQKFKGADDEAKTELRRGQFFHETTGLAEELAKKMDPIQKITDSQDINKIKDILTANKLSESQADWMAKELAGLDNYQEVKNFIRNKTAKNKENILENMGFKANADMSENKLNNFLVFIKNYSKDLAGKTNPVDRPFQENFFGRKVLNVIDFANKRFKANAVLGNLSSSLAQFFNIPQGVSSAGAENSIKSVGMTLADVFNKKSPINKSNFIKERYFNDYDKFDEGILANTKKMAVWVTGIGDKIGTKFIWNAHYQKALSQGLDNPVKYADDWTRKMVAGRGIGEVPIAQKSRIIQVMAPFQLEVANMWFALKDIAGDNPQKLILAKKMIEFTVASYLMNRVVKEVRGSDVSFDPMNAMFEAMNEYQEEEDKTTGAIKAGGRMVGEVVSNIPGGQTLASMYPEYGWRIGAKGEDGERKKIPRKELFGEGDPTRFGTGGLPMYSAFKNPQNILTTLVTPFGGKQIEKTVGGAKTLMDGYAESGAGQVMTPVNRDLTNVMQGLMFGKNAMGEVRDYYNNEDRPLSDLQGEKFKMMGNDREYFNSIKSDREANKEKEELKKNKSTGKAGQLPDDVYQLSNGKYYVKSLDKEFATPEKAQKELIKEEFKNSDQNFVDLGDTILRKSESGAVSEISKNKFNSMLYTAQLGLYKKNKDVGKWMETAEKQIEALGNSLTDPNIDELEKVEIESKMETLLNEYEKYQGYGGFIKPKVAKKLEEKWKYPVVNMDFMKIKNMLNDLNYKRQTGSRKTFFIPRKRVSKVSRRK